MNTSRNILITAGPTHEPIDAVRYVANRSSGRLGIALAEAARDAGWSVTLLLGPVGVKPPAGVALLRFQTAADLARLLDAHFPACDVLIMAAAVADYRPRAVPRTKLPRTADTWVLELEPVPDLVAACCQRKRPDQRVIGFALEDAAQLDRRAAEKLRRKRLDAIVANPLETMGATHVAATVLTAAGERVPLGAGQDDARPVSKRAFARKLLAWIDHHLDLPG